MIPFFKKKVKENTPPTFEHDEKSGVLRIEHDGETDGKGNLSLLEEFAKHRNFPILKEKSKMLLNLTFLGTKINVLFAIRQLFNITVVSFGQIKLLQDLWQHPLGISAPIAQP